MAKPVVVVRKKVARTKYIPFGSTQFDQLITDGKLEVVPLSEGGRAVGVTLRSILKYQKDVMGLTSLADDEPDAE